MTTAALLAAPNLTDITNMIDALGQRMARDLEGLLFVGDCERPTPTQDTPQ